MTEKVGLRAKCYRDAAGHALLARSSSLSNFGRELWKPRGQNKCVFNGLKTLKILITSSLHADLREICEWQGLGLGTYCTTSDPNSIDRNTRSLDTTPVWAQYVV